MTVLALVLIVWTIVAIVALALARTLCEVAARADAESEHMAPRPAGRPRHAPVLVSPDARRVPRMPGRTLVHR